MTIVDLNTALEHLRVDEPGERQIVELYLQAAEDAVIQFLNRPLYPDPLSLAGAREAGIAGEHGMVITPSVHSAILMILAGLYANRGDGPGTGGLPRQARWLLEPFRVGIGA